MTSQLKLICAAVALAAAGPVLGATTWTLGTTAINGTGVAGVNTDATASTVTTKVTGWANTEYSSAAATPDGYKLEQQMYSSNIAAYTGGIGINNRDGCSGSTTTCSGRDRNDLSGSQPEHAIDNEERYEMALLSFSSAVSLTDVVIGWPSGTSGYDTDITVLAYQGTTTFDVNTMLKGTTYGQLVANPSASVVGKGWVSVGNYSDLQQGVAKTINGGGLVSSYWLIGAYNPLANPSGGSVTIPGTGSPYDYIKLASVGGTYCTPGTPGCGGGPSSGTIPEPKSSQLALLGVGLLLGTMWMRRRARSR